MDTHDHFDEEENKKCKEHWGKCANEIQNADKTLGDTQLMILTELEKLLDEWYMYLNMLCMKYELLYVKKKSVTWQEKVESNYK